ncbi:MAG: tRNA (adenosine(37)-N6)-threonylcarbamoyltransferase complex ATPase subunit type 1 TsaE, partial [Bifidobacteriaceae bacterium]|nr:tRNA (adenosine(37)-N6)-threonylcarbamoyltransferase complex ATPase subunit type 1 TsaE [Bifidobacteriaceae bacterium]
MSIELPSAQDTRDFGTRLAGLLRAGDLIILAGELGAGKTTLVQGIGQGLGVRGQVASPTFVIARFHPPLGGCCPTPSACVDAVGAGLSPAETQQTNTVGAPGGLLSDRLPGGCCPTPSACVD